MRNSEDIIGNPGEKQGNTTFVSLGTGDKVSKERLTAESLLNLLRRAESAAPKPGHPTSCPADRPPLLRHFSLRLQVGVREVRAPSFQTQRLALDHAGPQPLPHLALSAEAPGWEGPSQARGFCAQPLAH